jgi:hypothetical protein
VKVFSCRSSSLKLTRRDQVIYIHRIDSEKARESQEVNCKIMFPNCLNCVLDFAYVRNIVPIDRAGRNDVYTMYFYYHCYRNRVQKK